MSFWSSFGSFWKKVGSLAKQGLVAAASAGFTDDLVKLAIPLVKEAALKYVDNGERREFVVDTLSKKGVPESLSRLAVELAVQIIKKG